MKRLRQAAILELVGAERIARQEILRTRLQARGFDVTQATLSRDLKELGLLKRTTDGAYQRPATAAEPAPESRDHALMRAVMDYLLRVESVGPLLVLKTDPGEAQPLARAIDRAALPDVAGTLAGDDTILVVVRSAEAAQRLTTKFLGWVGSLGQLAESKKEESR